MKIAMVMVSAMKLELANVKQDGIKNQIALVIFVANIVVYDINKLKTQSFLKKNRVWM